MPNKDRKLFLLDKFKDNDDLLELIDLIILDELEEREKVFYKSGSYPQERNLLGKLKFELKVRSAGSTAG